MTGFQVIIQGVSRNERRRLLELFRDAVRSDGEYKSTTGNYPFEGEVSSEGYEKVDKSKIFSDMSVEACGERYDESRQKTLENIRGGGVSASMSGIEWCNKDWCDLRMGNQSDEMIIKSALCWNGQFHISRPNWKAEFKDYKSGETE